MANDGSTQVPPNSTGNKIDCSSLSVAGATVYRQRVVLSDNTRSANFAVVSAGALQVIVTNNPVVSGAVSLATGANKIGFIGKISAGVALAAGAANIGTINNISAAVVVSGAVSIAAGTSKIGFIGKISAGVVLAAGANNIGTINNISANVTVVNAAGTNNIGSINNISATVLVAGETAAGASLSTTNKPVLIGGNDSAGGAGGIARTLLLDTSGRLILGAGAQNIGSINNISAGVVLAAGAANIGSINNISANVNVVIQAGANNIGTINNISAGIVLAAGAANIGTINNISAGVVLAAGAANIGTINNISAVVGVNIAAQSAGLALRMGGRVKTSASSTVGDATTNALWVDKNGRLVVVNHHPSLAPSASHGPKSVIISTSASVALIAAPGAGLVVYVDSICVTNGSSTLTLFQAYEASATAVANAAICGYLAANGGGFVRTYDPPLRVSANTALNGRVKPNVSQIIVDIHFHVGVD